MLVRCMDSTCKSSSFSGRLIVSKDITKANHNLLIALKLAEAWYYQSWPQICISPSPPT